MARCTHGVVWFRDCPECPFASSSMALAVETAHGGLELSFEREPVPPSNLTFTTYVIEKTLLTDLIAPRMFRIEG